MTKKKITKRTSDYSKWYSDIVEVAGLAEHSVTRGCMVIKPYGYSIWETIQRILDKKIKDTNHENVYFPLLIPKSILSKEATHIKGFAKECAVVTHTRLKISEDGKETLVVDPDSKLEEEIIVRPTSEAIMYDTFARWVESWRDLPILLNQWANCVRWEMRTRFFLRTTEFLWQEGHTAHETPEEAETEAIKMLKVYASLARDYLAMPVVLGKKSKSEMFPGAHHTYTVEALMQDGKALQAGTSHNLGDNFAKAFEIKFSDREGKKQYVWQTSWGVSTRIIGGLIMTHSDDKGLVLPPKVAPVQVVLIPIWKNDIEKEKVLNYATDISKICSPLISFKIDTREFLTPGAKFNDWEKKGVPIRLEIGTNEVEGKVVTMVRRDTSDKSIVQLDVLDSEVANTLEVIQKSLYNRAKKFRNENTHKVQTYEEFKDILAKKKGFISAFWCEDAACEEKIKAETKATTRCLPLEGIEEEGRCIYCNKGANHRWLFAVAY